MKKLMCLFTLILLVGITFIGQTQDVSDTDISDFKLSMRIMINETNPIALRVKSYLITAFREVSDISIVKRDEDVVLQVSVSEATTTLTVNERVETLSCYIGAATPHLRIPPEYIELISKGPDKTSTQSFLTFQNTQTPVWVGRTSLPFVVMPSTEAGLERECAKVVSTVNILLHKEWESLRAIRQSRNMLKEVLKTK